MKINLEWLREYIEIGNNTEEIIEAMNMSGLEVEGVEETGGERILDVSVTPNRPDWLSHVGVARELAAVFGKKLRYPDTDTVERGPRIDELTSVEIEDSDGCPRYCARVVKGVSIGPSPDKIARRLESVGVRAINNVVDATNYVMLEMGQPLHAFDYRRLVENRIVVRKAVEGEIMQTLDGQDRELNRNDLLICDGSGPVALAGIMGGLNSEVCEDTVDLLLESAFFDPVTIRRSSKRLGLSTEASYRFERGTDVEGTAAAVNRLAGLISDWAGGQICAGIYDAYPGIEEKREVAFGTAKINEYLGTDIPAREIVSILERLGMDVMEKGGNGRAIVPSFRRDLKREEDLVEEVARIFGYQNIPITMPVGRTVPIKVSKMEKIQSTVRTNLEGMDFSEALTYSFIARSDVEELGLGGGPDPIGILNPISSEMEIMRTSILPGLLKAARTNTSRQAEEVRLYEMGRVFLPRSDGNLPDEKIRVAAVMVGDRSSKSWYRENEEADFFDVKGAVESLLASLGVSGVSFVEMNVHYLQPGQSAWVMAGKSALGPVGTLHPDIRERFLLRKWAGCFELDLQLIESTVTGRSYRPIPQFPALRRDLAVVVHAGITTEDLEATMNDAANDLADVKLFDIYEGKGIPEGHRSMAYALAFQSMERTMNDDEVDASIDNILKALEKEHGAKLR